MFFNNKWCQNPGKLLLRVSTRVFWILIILMVMDLATRFQNRESILTKRMFKSLKEKY